MEKFDPIVEALQILNNRKEPMDLLAEAENIETPYARRLEITKRLGELGFEDAVQFLVKNVTDTCQVQEMRCEAAISLSKIQYSTPSVQNDAVDRLCHVLKTANLWYLLTEIIKALGTMKYLDIIIEIQTIDKLIKSMGRPENLDEALVDALVNIGSCYTISELDRLITERTLNHENVYFLSLALQKIKEKHPENYARWQESKKRMLGNDSEGNNHHTLSSKLIPQENFSAPKPFSRKGHCTFTTTNRMIGNRVCMV